MLTEFHQCESCYLLYYPYEMVADGLCESCAADDEYAFAVEAGLFDDGENLFPEYEVD